jgi:hypothetical protein
MSCDLRADGSFGLQVTVLLADSPWCRKVRTRGVVARIVISIIGGLAVSELIEPGSVRLELLGEARALVYAGLVARVAGPGAS